VLCDVILVASQISLQRVQVEQRLGVNHAQLWIPRPTTRRISTGDGVQLQRRSTRGTVEAVEPTPFDDMDGDVVLVDFIEGDLDFPIIRGAMEHEQTLRSVIEGSGWQESEGGSERGTAHKDESYRRWAGVEERINAAGDYLLDTVGATDDLREEDPSSGDGGQIRFRLKDSKRFTVEMDGEDVLEVFVDGGQARIDLGEAATQRLVLGDDFRTFLNDWLSNIFEGHMHLAGTNLTAPSGGGAVTGQTGTVAPTTIPPDGTNFLGNEMSEDLLSDLARTKKG
jgi:hypothetical protein